MSHIHSSQIKLTLQTLHLGKVKIVIQVSQIKSSVVKIINNISLGPTDYSVCRRYHSYEIVSISFNTFFFSFWFEAVKQVIMCNFLLEHLIRYIRDVNINTTYRSLGIAFTRLQEHPSLP